MANKKDEHKFEPVVKGIIGVSGGRDVGKTVFALQCGAHPSRIAFIDDDEKGRITVEQLEAAGSKFGYYANMKRRTAGMAQLQAFREFEAVIGELEDVAKNERIDAIIWDTWSRYASAMNAHVRKNPTAFREKGGYAGKGDIKGGQQWKDTFEFEAQRMARLGQIAPVVILITHLKDHRVGSRRTGKKIPDATRAMDRVPSFRVWLRRNPSGSPVPVALVMKRISVSQFEEGIGIRTTNILPSRVAPVDGERSVWDAIKRYVNAPVGERELLPEETPNKFEVSLIDGTMTDDEKRILTLMLAADVDAEPDLGIEGDAVDEVDTVDVVGMAEFESMRDEMGNEGTAKQLKEQGKSYKEIKDIFESAGITLTVGAIVKWCR